MSLRFVVMLLYVLGASGTALFRPFWGLIGLVAMYYFRPDVWNQPDWFRPQLWLTAAIGLGWVLQAKKIRLTPTMLVAFLASGTLFIGSFTAAEDTATAYEGAVTVFKLVLVMFLTLNLVDTADRINTFLWANVAGMLWNLKSIIATGLRGGEVTEQRVDLGVGQGGGSNYIAMVLVAAIAFLWVRAQEGTARERSAAKFLIPLHVLALITTGSRAGFLAFGAVLLWMTARSRKKFGAVIMAGLLGILFIVAVPDSFVDRFRSGVGGEGNRDGSAQSRILLWKGAVTMFLERPITGVGMDNYALMSPRYVGFYASRSYTPYEPGVKGPGFVTHSTWFQTLAEGGILTAVPYFLMFAMAWFATVRIKASKVIGPAADSLRANATAMQGILIAIVLTSSFGSHMKIDFLWWYVGLISAMSLAIDKERLAERERVRRIAAARPEPLAPVTAGVGSA